MSLLSRYVVARWWAHLAFVTAVLCGLYLAVDTPEVMGRGWAAVLGKVPLVVVHVLPLAAAASLLTAFHWMKLGGGLGALRASGVPWRRILAPVLVAGLAVAALEAMLAFHLAPAALDASDRSRPAGQAPPSWVLQDGVVSRLGPDGAILGSWNRATAEPLPAGAAPPSLAALAGSYGARRPPAAAGMTDLIAAAGIASRLGRDPRPETVELWTRALMPLSLLMLLAGAAASVARERPPWKAALWLGVSFAVAWIGLSVSIQLHLNGLSPGWVIAAAPTAVLAALALL